VPDIYQMQDEDGRPILVTPLYHGTTRESLLSVWDRLEELREAGYAVCSMCSRAIPKDKEHRGPVLDSSGRCDECRP
jgi:hypothetical protein